MDSRWQEQNAREKRAGSTLLALTAGLGPDLLAHWLSPEGTIRTYRVAAENRRVPSLTPVLPEVGYDEREISDEWGIMPIGHPDLRPLIPGRKGGPTACELPIRTVEGDGVTVMTVGPSHAGIIESGRFVFSLMGENILHLDLHLFQKYRGLERLLEGRPLDAVGPLISRVCGSDSVSHQVNWVGLLEQAAGYEPPEPVLWGRILLLEAERVLSHLNDVAQIPAGTGFQVAHQKGLALKERWQEGIARIVGRRWLFDTIRRGGVQAGQTADWRQLLEEMKPLWHRWRHLVESHHGFHDRMTGVGRLTETDAQALGAAGVVARASGIRWDARLYQPLYRALGLRPTTETRGDVFARFRVRLDEIEEAWRIMEAILAAAPASLTVTGFDGLDIDVDGTWVAFSESPHGLNAHVVTLEQGRIRRYHIRSGSYRNWPAMAFTVRGNLVGDFPLINKSFELCYSCHDR